ncbi:unnamed protein product [Zymoseptoria tritici ST99CH_1A5]|uniref:Uncharacterized protein n=1 Tax=Zymoseptoria tritici ST99CH_1A5 TaxID=1276529 RepID=A0A1Y6M0M1_ZYMTR|nr:unnamed protein product [Zymoseptoria tritici ST99CH_1A5]
MSRKSSIPPSGELRDRSGTSTSSRQRSEPETVRDFIHGYSVKDKSSLDEDNKLRCNRGLRLRNILWTKLLLMGPPIRRGNKADFEQIQRSLSFQSAYLLARIASDLLSLSAAYDDLDQVLKWSSQNRKWEAEGGTELVDDNDKDMKEHSDDDEEYKSPLDG